MGIEIKINPIIDQDITEVIPKEGSLIVEPLINPGRQRTESGIILLDKELSIKEYKTKEDMIIDYFSHPFQAIVRWVGKPFKDEPMEFQPGDHILLNHELGVRNFVLINQVMYAHVNRGDIICIVKH